MRSSRPTHIDLRLTEEVRCLFFRQCDNKINEGMIIFYLENWLYLATLLAYIRRRYIFVDKYVVVKQKEFVRNLYICTGPDHGCFNFVGPFYYKCKKNELEIY